jgi:hypothetical protein
MLSRSVTRGTGMSGVVHRRTKTKLMLLIAYCLALCIC